MTTATLPSLATQARLIDAGTLRPAVRVTAAPNGYACYLTPRCPLWMGCDCPPYAPLSMAPRRR